MTMAASQTSAPQGYDPTASQPYTPVAPPPEIMPAPNPLADKPAFQFEGHGNISHAGAIAGVLDNVLKGYMGGVAQGQQYKALLMKKKGDDLTASYNADAQRLLQIKEKQLQTTGKFDPNDAEYKQALSAATGSYGALRDFQGQILQQQLGKKASKQDKDRPPGAILTDPKSTGPEKAWAMWQLQGKVGPPILGQLQSMDVQHQQWLQSDQGKAWTANQAAGAAHAGNTLTHEQAQATYDKYAGWTDEQLKTLSPEEQKKFANAKAIITPPTKETGTTREFESPDSKSRKWFVPGTEPPDWNAVTTDKSSLPKIGTLGEAMRTYAQENGLDPNNIPTAVQNYVHQKWAWDGRGDTSTTTTTLKQDAENQWVPVTEVNAHNRGPEPKPPSGMKAMTFGLPANAPAPSGAQAITPAAIQTPPTTSGGTTTPGFTPTRRQKPSGTPPPASAPRGGATRVGAPIMGAPDASLTQMREDAQKKRQEYEEAVQKSKNLTGPGSQDIVMAWTRSQIAGAGRLSNVELQNNLSAGSYGERFANAWSRAKSGTLDPAFVQKIVADMKISSDTASKELMQEIKKRNEGTVLGAQQGGAVNTLPDAAKSQLRAGHVTTFANGQKWTLDASGQPQQVQ